MLILNGRAEIERAVSVAARWCKHEEHPATQDRLDQAVRATKPRAYMDTDIRFEQGAKKQT